MSEPTRYSPAGDGVVRTDPKGPLINHYYYEQLKAENAELKAEVVRLQQVRGYEHYLSAEIGSMNQENARLKAEVERLTAFTTRTIIPNEELQADVKDLRAELAEAQESNHILNEIIAMMRKEGKQ